jgi:hypothetical protein
MKTFAAQVRINGFPREVRVQAQNFAIAKEMLEAQYGKGSVVIWPREVR